MICCQSWREPAPGTARPAAGWSDPGNLAVRDASKEIKKLLQKPGMITKAPEQLDVNPGFNMANEKVRAVYYQLLKIARAEGEKMLGLQRAANGNTRISMQGSRRWWNITGMTVTKGPTNCWILLKSFGACGSPGPGLPGAHPVGRIHR